MTAPVAKRKKPIKHADLVATVRLALAHDANVCLWPNNSGQAQFSGTGGKVHRVRYGLATGSADLIGIMLEPHRFLSIECKIGDDPVRPEQEFWLKLIRQMGGFATVLRVPADAALQVAHDMARAAVLRAVSGACE